MLALSESEDDQPYSRRGDKSDKKDSTTPKSAMLEPTSGKRVKVANH